MNNTVDVTGWEQPLVNATVSDIRCRSSYIWRLLLGQISYNSTVLMDAGFNITDSELLNELVFGLIWRKYVSKYVIPSIVMFLNVLGIFGSALVLIVIQHKGYSGKETFKFFMATIATVDLMFNLLDLPLNIMIRIVLAVSIPNATKLYFMIVLLGVVNTFSSIGDLSALGLTFERYVATCWPFYWHCLPNEWKAKVNYSFVAVFVLVSLLRMSETAKYVVGTSENNSTTTIRYYVKIRPFKHTRWYHALELTNVVVVPVIFTVLMLYLTIHTAVLLRRRSKLLQHYSTTSTHSRSVSDSQGNSISTITCDPERDREKGTNNINVLMFITAISTVVCEVSYTAVWLANALVGEESLLSLQCNNKVAIKHRMIVSTKMFVLRDMTNMLEFCNRSSNFYNYYLFSRMFRRQCKQRLRALFDDWKLKFSRVANKFAHAKDRF